MITLLLVSAPVWNSQAVLICVVLVGKGRMHVFGCGGIILGIYEEHWNRFVWNLFLSVWISNSRVKEHVGQRCFIHKYRCQKKEIKSGTLYTSPRILLDLKIFNSSSWSPCPTLKAPFHILLIHHRQLNKSFCNFSERLFFLELDLRLLVFSAHRQLVREQVWWKLISTQEFEGLQASEQSSRMLPSPPWPRWPPDPQPFCWRMLEKFSSRDVCWSVPLSEWNIKYM